MALVSLTTFQVVVGGAEGHAGTLPQHERRDALAAFARAAAALHAEIGAIDAQIKFTIGRVTIEPNAPSVVPSRVSFSIDLRHPDNGMLDAAAARVAALCHRHAPPCAVTITPLVDAPSNDFDPKLRQHIARAAHDLGSPAMAILSTAGHDARHLAKVCPAPTIFIPCRDGASHVEQESAEPGHVAAGASVLAQLLRDLAFCRVAFCPSRGLNAATRLGLQKLTFDTAMRQCGQNSRIGRDNTIQLTYS